MMRKHGIWVGVLLLAACSRVSGGETPTAAVLLPAVINPAEGTQPAQTAVIESVAAVTPSPAPTFTPTMSPTPAATRFPMATFTPPSAAEFPDPAEYVWTPVVNGLRSPIGMAHAGDGSGRVFILEQSGAIRILKDEMLAPAPFLDIIANVSSEGNEQGLLGLAFHPRYTENGYFYVNYTRRPDGATVIARYQVSADDPDRADPNSEMELMVIEQPYANHNGGAVVFGPDGYLYLALGDGGAAGDPHNNGQSKDSLLGKILRVDVDGGEPYTVPADNPFAGGGGAPEIWAYGLRNPWRIAFDRLTGDLFIADVGQNQWEEINHLPADAAGGANFGWNFFEASHPYQGALPPGISVIAPVAEYSHAEGGCSVTGGSVYRGQALPGWQGIYIYGDYCTGNVWGLLMDAAGNWQSRLQFTNVGRIASFGEDEAGEIYLLDRMGAVYRLEAQS